MQCVVKNIFKVRFNRQYSSLYITGDKANKTYSILTPHVDFTERITQKEELENNIKLRKINVNLEKIASRWSFYKHLSEQRANLEYTRNELSKEITKLIEEPEKNQTELERLKTHASQAKNDLVNLKDFMYGVEESAALGALSLPNILHANTPIEKELELSYNSVKRLQEITTKCHTKICPEFFHFVEPSVVYLLKDAALFEIAISNYFQNKLTEFQFVPISSPNFSTGIISEGCQSNYTDLLNIKVDNIDNKLHLKGSASLTSFMAYFARFQIQATQFPIKLATLGRTYQRLFKKPEKICLFNLSQQSAFEIFVATKDDQDAQFKFLTNYVTELYKTLGYNFRCVLLPAHELKLYESLRFSIQMYSNHTNSYIEVGNVSLCENYLSKRLLVTYVEANTRKYAQVISGTVMNVHKVLGCVIENNEALKKGKLMSKAFDNVI